MPEVFISSGDFFQSGVVRVVIDAPRSIVILRRQYRDNRKPMNSREILVSKPAVRTGRASGCMETPHTHSQDV